MNINVLIIAVLLLAFCGCKSRKVASNKTSQTAKSEISEKIRERFSYEDTSSKQTTISRETSDSSKVVVKIYPTNGKPITLTSGETFTGEADSVLINHKKGRKANENVAEVEQKKTVAAGEKRTDRDESFKGKTTTAQKDVVSEPSFQLHWSAACALILIVIAVVLFAKYLVRRSKDPTWNQHRYGYTPTHDVTSPPPGGDDE